MCLYYLKTARCICHFEFLSSLSFLAENSNTIIIAAFAQNVSVWTAIRLLVSLSV